MRASHQEQVGSAGVSEVSADFERLGWGVAENTRHDLGTDLFIMARDERLFDLGLVVGVQVKAGPRYFREPSHDTEGKLTGWWFRDDNRSHVDAWLSHGLPHLIVLHDVGTRTSYWQHVTADNVVGTGKGAKVLVPESNRVDAQHRQALLEVAATVRPAVAWEGSAWTEVASLAPKDLMRHALVVPRLIAPHANTSYSRTLTPTQALALLVQVRLRDFEEYAKAHDDVPTLSDAVTSPNWSWRFIGALGHRLTSGRVDGLLPLVDDAPNPPERAAAAVAAATGLLEEARADQAIDVLEAVLARDEAGPVDHAWLTMQHARACAEVGRLDEARDEALAVQTIRTTHPQDVTATAIAGVAAALLFNTSDWRQKNIEGVITGLDTTAAWWRTQTTAWGLSALAERTFKGWARDTRVTFAASDAVRDDLLGASLTANNAGDHDAWRNLSSLLGKDSLMRLDRHAPAEQARSGLEALRLAGDADALKLAVPRLANDGPATAVTLAAAGVRLDVSTRTTGPADLTLLESGGDLIDEDTADRSVAWLLDSIADPSAFVARTDPAYLVITRLVDALAAVSPAAPSSARDKVVGHVLSLPSQDDQLVATSWGRVVLRIPEEVWDSETAFRAMQSSDRHHATLRFALLQVASRQNATAREQLLEQARGGSFRALEALGDVTKLPGDVVTSLMDRLVEQVKQQVEDARRGKFGGGGHRIGHSLALLNTWHLDLARWEPLFRLLEDEAVIGSNKAGALNVLFALAERLPEDVRQRLIAVALRVAAQPSRRLPFFDDDAAGSAAALSAVLEPEKAGLRLAELLMGSADDRRLAAAVAFRSGRPEGAGILVTLSQDQECAVRAEAAAGLARLVAAEQGGPLAGYTLERCLKDPGRRIAANIASAIASTPDHSAAAAAALAQLRSHVSAHVRATAGAG